MPTFKPKNTRKIIVNSKNTITLDRKHSELLVNSVIYKNFYEKQLRKD